jgi:hypothetical protein
MKKDNNRIKHALYLEGWTYETGNVQELLLKGRKILTVDFHESMLGSIFCPGCKTSLSRSPKNKPTFSNSRQACFVHLPSYSEVECDLRTPKPEGMKYPTEELALQAIAHDQLAIVSSFMATPPERISKREEPYSQSAVEDLHGPISEVPISRHSGETFKLPSKISTVAGICRRFDENLYKYYVLPGEVTAARLVSSLTGVEQVEAIDDTPKLYWGEIVSSHNSGNTPKPSNLRMTKLRCSHSIIDFYLKAVDSEQTEKGIGDKSGGRVVLFWGKITWNGIGLCVERPAWGEYALLPEKYDYLLKTG